MQTHQGCVCFIIPLLPPSEFSRLLGAHASVNIVYLNDSSFVLKMIRVLIEKPAGWQIKVLNDSAVQKHSTDWGWSWSRGWWRWWQQGSLTLDRAFQAVQIPSLGSATHHTQILGHKQAFPFPKKPHFLLLQDPGYLTLHPIYSRSQTLGREVSQHSSPRQLLNSCFYSL